MSTLTEFSSFAVDSYSNVKHIFSDSDDPDTFRKELNLNDLNMYLENLRSGRKHEYIPSLEALGLIVMNRPQYADILLNNDIVQVCSQLMKGRDRDPLVTGCLDLLNIISGRLTFSPASGKKPKLVESLVQLCQSDNPTVASSAIQSICSIIRDDPQLTLRPPYVFFLYQIPSLLKSKGITPDAKEGMLRRVSSLLKELELFGIAPDGSVKTTEEEQKEEDIEKIWQKPLSWADLVEWMNGYLYPVLSFVADGDDASVAQNALLIMNTLSKVTPIDFDEKKDKTQDGGYRQDKPWEINAQDLALNRTTGYGNRPASIPIRTGPKPYPQYPDDPTEPLLEVDVHNEMFFINPTPHIAIIDPANRVVMIEEMTTCFSIGQIIDEGIWKCEMRFDKTDKFRCFGIVSAYVDVPGEYKLGRDEFSLGYYGLNGPIRHDGRWTTTNISWGDDDIVGIEVDMEDEPRSCSFWVNSMQQYLFVRGIPDAIRFCFGLSFKNSSCEVLSLKKVPVSTTKKMAGRKCFFFHEDK
ncbi:hypothetical protein BLNAU_273 [Blattamonas nauphoetae]|uniref:B30.2/SPRY domain-containing protein n=1 Tax=Blattamonas nauphoetae TaxID=2049346 RepID=A0ABQ9YMJ8_9EUKA|nr:hypothetical protein BLNAU_273 [Blattamonas nauphoetae]